MVIREANSNDIDGIANVHVNSWQSTYKGIISNSFLSGLTVEKRKKNWEWQFKNLNTDEKNIFG